VQHALRNPFVKGNELSCTGININRRENSEQATAQQKVAQEAVLKSIRDHRSGSSKGHT